MQVVDSGCVPETQQDELGRTPLHIAVLRACDITVIERLLNIKGNPAGIPDNSKRYPLHCACANPSGLFKATVSKLATDKSLENMVQIISALIVAFPKAANLMDNEGWTPTSLARKHKADRRIQRLMSFAADLEQKPNDSKISQDMAPPSTVATSNMQIPLEVTCYHQDDDDDDVSSVDWMGGTVEASDLGGNVVDACPHNSKDVIEHCWFI
jgi:ankyrin repeat protein